MEEGKENPPTEKSWSNRPKRIPGYHWYTNEEMLRTNKEPVLIRVYEDKNQPFGFDADLLCCEIPLFCALKAEERDKCWYALLQDEPPRFDGKE